MILSVEVILPLVKVSIFPSMTSMVEKLAVFMFAVPLELIVLMLPVLIFAKFVTVNKSETKFVVVKPLSSND